MAAGVEGDLLLNLRCLGNTSHMVIQTCRGGWQLGKYKCGIVCFFLTFRHPEHGIHAERNENRLPGLDHSGAYMGDAVDALDVAPSE